MARDPFAHIARTAPGLAGKKKPAPAAEPIVQGVIPGKRAAPAKPVQSKAPSRDKLARAAQAHTASGAGEIEPGDSEAANAEEMSELLKGFKARASNEEDRFELATDGAFYACLVFPSTQIRDAFFDAVKCPEAKDFNFINGVHLAERMGVTLPPTPKMGTGGRSSAPWLTVGTMPLK